jgi:hypothetical protein
LGLDDSDGSLEVEAARETGCIRLKIDVADSVGCLWSGLTLTCGSDGVANTNGFRGRTSDDFPVLDEAKVSRSGVSILAKALEVIKRLVPLLDLLDTEASESDAGLVSKTDLKLMFAGGLYAIFGFG